MTTAHAIDTALVYLNSITVSGVNNVIALARAIDALIQAKQPEDKPEIKPIEEGDTNGED